MKARLAGRVKTVLSDRTGVARQTATIQAVRPSWLGKVTGAHRDIVAPRAKGADRTSAQAGLVRAAVAGHRDIFARRQIDRLGEEQGAAIGVPKAKAGMD